MPLQMLLASPDFCSLLRLLGAALPRLGPGPDDHPALRSLGLMARELDLAGQRAFINGREVRQYNSAAPCAVCEAIQSGWRCDFSAHCITADDQVFARREKLMQHASKHPDVAALANTSVVLQRWC